MRKVLSIFLTLLALLALCVPARADMLWEPYGNIFYDKHFGSCDYIGRDYYANGAEGFVTLWDAPAAAWWRPSTRTGPGCASTGSIRTGAASLFLWKGEAH